MGIALLLPVVVSNLVWPRSLYSFQGMTSRLFPTYKRAASLAGSAPGKNLLGKGTDRRARAVQ